MNTRNSLKSISTIQRGFTIVELVTVIIIIGIIGAVVIPKFFDNATYQNRAAADQVRAALKFGQKMAISSHHQVGVAISSAAQTNCTNTVTFSGTTVITGSVNCAVAVTLTNNASPYYFDSLGEPVPSTGTPPLPAQGSITVGSLTDGGATIYIEQETGYVH
jgi:MSHA pilin protein MshC